MKHPELKKRFDERNTELPRSLFQLHIHTKNQWRELERNSPSKAKKAQKNWNKFKGTCHYECECLMAYEELYESKTTNSKRTTATATTKS